MPFTHVFVVRSFKMVATSLYAVVVCDLSRCNQEMRKLQRLRKKASRLSADELQKIAVLKGITELGQQNAHASSAASSTSVVCMQENAAASTKNCDGVLTASTSDAIDKHESCSPQGDSNEEDENVDGELDSENAKVKHND